MRRWLTLLLTILLLAGCAATGKPQLAPTWQIETRVDLPPFLGEAMHAAVYLPPRYDAHRRYPVLYVNDGQDRDAVGLQATLQRLSEQKRIAPFVVVAIDMPKDRAAAYGLSDRATASSVVGDSRIGPIGTNAQAYSQWLSRELVAYVDAHYATDARPRGRAVLGWSLGGLNAFNLGWQYPDVFATVGAFSPSFWLSSERGTPQAAQRTRLAQRMVAAGPKREGSRFWLEAGDAEESSDRDGDGVIDVIDDMQDIARGYDQASGEHQRGLAELGYGGDALMLRVLPDGKHAQPSWARMLPDFLCWAFPAHGER